jgi:hypothetical protein
MASVSLSGLDLEFMWNSPPVKMKKKKRDRTPSKRSDIACPYLMGDISPFQSPVDGDYITSRSKLRAHERKHQIKQCGDFKPGEIIAKENKRHAHSLKAAEGVKSEWVD